MVMVMVMVVMVMMMIMTTMMTKRLPHSPLQWTAGLVQLRTSVLDPRHSRLSVSEDLHALVRTCDPWPQLALHWDHWLQSDQPSSCRDAERHHIHRADYLLSLQQPVRLGDANPRRRITSSASINIGNGKLLFIVCRRQTKKYIGYWSLCPFWTQNQWAAIQCRENFYCAKFQAIPIRGTNPHTHAYTHHTWQNERNIGAAVYVVVADSKCCLFQDSNAYSDSRVTVCWAQLGLCLLIMFRSCKVDFMIWHVDAFRINK